MTTNRNRTVAINAKAAIIAANLTIEEAARSIAVPATTLRRHLDTGTLTVPEVVAIAELTGTDARDFFTTNARQRTAA